MREHRTSVLLALMIVLSGTAPVLASEAASATVARSGLRWLDWVILAAYCLLVLGVGWYYSRKQEDTQEYFTGSGRMSPFLIGVSIFATLLSTISYRSFPGEAIAKGPGFLYSLLNVPISFMIVGFVIIPAFMRQRVTSAYELLEDRLGVGIRLLGACMFVLLRLVWMSLLMYVACEALAVMIGMDQKYIWALVLISGFIAVMYTSLGGLRAVVITDLLQSILLFGGAIVVLGVITAKFGGFGWFPTEWQAHWDKQPFLPESISTRVFTLGVIINTIVWQVCTAGGDQTTVQRFMATADVKSARRSYLVNLIVASTVVFTLCLVGFAVMSYMQAFPGSMPADITLRAGADNAFPYFIANYLPMGVSGLVLAALFAAAMSSTDSGINSITAVVMTDFLDRFGRKPKTERAHLLTARTLAFVIGAIVVVGSIFMKKVPGNITGMTMRTGSLLVTPIFCLFFFAMFVPFAKPLGVLCGAVAGTTTAVLIAFAGPIFIEGYEKGVTQDPISFLWIGIAALLVNVLVGTVVSLALPARKQTAEASG